MVVPVGNTEGAAHTMIAATTAAIAAAPAERVMYASLEVSSLDLRAILACSSPRHRRRIMCGFAANK
jgi:hypothetical protein